MRCLTVRSIIIGLIFVIGMSCLHMWMFVSNATVNVSSVLIILTAHVIGKVWSLIPWEIVAGGPWTIKEHTLVLIMGNIAWTFFTVYNFSTLSFVQWVERQPSFKFVHIFFLIVAVQFLGFGLAGILRRFLVWPSGQVWPINLPSIALLRTLHENQIMVKQKMYGINNKQTVCQRFIANRLTFFVIIMIVYFVYCWLPGYIMPILSAFSWMCMIQPSNYLLAQITGYYGLGIGSLSFDWFDVSWYLGSPLIVPRWALVNIAVGFVLITWVITPIIYFQDVWGTRSNPIALRTGSTGQWSAVGLVSTAVALANLSAVLVHMLLHHSHEWWTQLRTRSLNKKGNDVHCRLIALYPDVPDWWFAIVSLLALIVIIIVGQVSDMLAWYNILFSLVVPIVFVLPFGMVASITGQTIHNPSVYYLSVLIATSLWVNNVSKMFTFVAIGYTTYCQTLELVSNMKLGHYMKIAPRTLFLAQALACLACASVSIGMQYYFYAVQRYYDTKGASNFISVYDTTNIGAAISQNVNFFDSSTLRNRYLLWSLLIGVVLPVPFWLASRRWKWCHLIHIPLVLSFVSRMSLEWVGNMFTWIVIGLLTTMFCSKLCWKRHVYLTSSALDAGLGFFDLLRRGPLVIYKVTFPVWWGLGGITGDGCPISLQNATGYQYSPE